MAATIRGGRADVRAAPRRSCDHACDSALLDARPYSFSSTALILAPRTKPRSPRGPSERPTWGAPAGMPEKAAARVQNECFRRRRREGLALPFPRRRRARNDDRGFALTIEGSGLGVHRSIDPIGVLPQAAWRLDNRPQVWPSEARLDLETLALDPVVFRRLRDEAGGDPGRLRATVLETVAERSKLQDPSTGRGGSLLGRISETGRDYPRHLQIGARVALPAALGLTPLWLADVAGWDGATPLVPARGHAIVFPSSPIARVPHDLAARFALSVLEVAPVVATLRRRLRPGNKVIVLGGARPAGAFASVAAREGGAARVLSVVTTWQEACLVEALGAATPTVADVTDPLATALAVRERLAGLCDLVVVCEDVKGAEAGALLATRSGGTAVFIASEATCAGLADVARSLSCDVEILVAGGPVRGAAEDAFELLTTYQALGMILCQESALPAESPPLIADRSDARRGGRAGRQA